MNDYFIAGFEKTADALTDELKAREQGLDESIAKYKKDQDYLGSASLGAAEGLVGGLTAAQGLASGIGAQFLGHEVKNFAAKHKGKAGILMGLVGAGLGGLKHYLDRKTYEAKVLMPQAIGILDTRDTLRKRQLMDMLYGNQTTEG